MSSEQTFKASAYLAPRHWPTWLGLALLRLCVYLPWSIQVKLGTFLGVLLYHLHAERRHIARVNIRLCFPELEETQRERMVRDSFISTAISVFEGGMSWWGGDERNRALYRIEGLEHYERIRARGKGMLLLGGHYTTLEISGRFLAFHVEGLQPSYKPAHNPLFEAVMAGNRKRLFDDLLPSADVRSIVRNLKKGKVVWLAPDQDFGRKRSVFAPFMGVQTASLTVTSRLAKMADVPVLPYFSMRLPGAEGFLIRLLPPLEDFPSGDDVADAGRINAVLEELVREAPEQYLWVHKRFKTRPPGEAKVY